MDGIQKSVRFCWHHSDGQTFGRTRRWDDNIKIDEKCVLYSNDPEKRLVERSFTTAINNWV